MIESRLGVRFSVRSGAWYWPTPPLLAQRLRMGWRYTSAPHLCLHRQVTGWPLPVLLYVFHGKRLSVVTYVLMNCPHNFTCHFAFFFFFFLTLLIYETHYPRHCFNSWHSYFTSLFTKANQLCWLSNKLNLFHRTQNTLIENWVAHLHVCYSLVLCVLYSTQHGIIHKA